MVILAVFVALAVALGDFAALRPDSPPARAAALTAPDGGSARISSSRAPNRLTAARPAANAVVRGVYPYAQWDTHQRSVDGTAATQTNAGTWRIGLENGTYAVALVMGDPVTMNQTNDVTINGVTQTDPSPAVTAASSTLERGAFDGYAVTATVTDGTLTITVPASAKDSKLCFLEIGARGSAADAALAERVRSAVAQANRLTDQEFPPLVPSPRTVYGSYVDELLAILPASGVVGERKFVHANHLYSVAALTDNTGAVVERYRYDAYGQRIVLAGDGVTLRWGSPHGNQVGFTGRYLDKETGLWHFRLRYYSASLGRFANRDPTGYFDGQNLYSAYYIPNGIDPLGLSTLTNCSQDRYEFNFGEWLEAAGFGDQSARVVIITRKCDFTCGTKKNSGKYTYSEARVEARMSSAGGERQLPYGIVVGFTANIWAGGTGIAEYDECDGKNESSLNFTVRADVSGNIGLGFVNFASAGVLRRAGLSVSGSGVYDWNRDKWLGRASWSLSGEISAYIRVPSWLHYEYNLLRLSTGGQENYEWQ